jgi:hypothetical protein
MADAAAIDVSRKKWRRDAAELITSFIVQPCEARRCASGWNVVMNKLLADLHGVCHSRLHPIVRTDSEQHRGIARKIGRGAGVYSVFLNSLAVSHSSS